MSRAKVLASSHLEGGPVLSDVVVTPPILGRGEEMANPDFPVAPDIGRRAARHIDPTPHEQMAVGSSRADPPAHIVDTLAKRPASALGALAQINFTDAINRYRAKYAVEGDDTIGSRPFEPGRAWPTTCWPRDPELRAQPLA